MVSFQSRRGSRHSAYWTLQLLCGSIKWNKDNCTALKMLSLPRITQKSHHVPPSPSPSHQLCRSVNTDPEQSRVPFASIQKDDGCPTLSSSFSDHNGQGKPHFTPWPWSHIHTHQGWNKNISQRLHHQRRSCPPHSCAGTCVYMRSTK